MSLSEVICAIIARGPDPVHDYPRPQPRCWWPKLINGKVEKCYDFSASPVYNVLHYPKATGRLLAKQRSFALNYGVQASFIPGARSATTGWGKLYLFYDAQRAIRDQWSEWDSTCAREAGWSIIINSYGEWIIGSIGQRFTEDNDAREWVVSQANKGSARHERALNIVMSANIRGLLP